MAADQSSRPSTPAESEDSMACQLILTTLAGNEIPISMNIAQHDRLAELEDNKVDYATVTMSDVFGCEVDLVHPNTQEHLRDPIWNTLRINTSFDLVVRECMEVCQSKRQFQESEGQEYPKAVKVPSNISGVIPDSAFYSIFRLRHVLAEEGLHTVGALAWRTCRQLRIVEFPATVVRIEESSFQGCYLLGSVEAPGCADFGYRGANTFVAATKLAPYLFDGCLNLSSITLTQASFELGQSTALSLLREIPQGCFGSSRLRCLKLPSDISLLGPLACDNCKHLAFVDLSSTPITEVREYTFSHCVRLQHLWLPKTLQTIHVKAFMGSAAFFGSLIEALHAWCMFVCYKLAVDIRREST